jgi:hypothetical protein
VHLFLALARGRCGKGLHGANCAESPGSQQSSNGRTFWIADAHRDDGKRFVVHADEKLTAFLELESAVCVSGELV